MRCGITKNEQDEVIKTRGGKYSISAKIVQKATWRPTFVQGVQSLSTTLPVSKSRAATLPPVRRSRHRWRPRVWTVHRIRLAPQGMIQIGEMIVSAAWRCRSPARVTNSSARLASSSARSSSFVAWATSARLLERGTARRHRSFSLPPRGWIQCLTLCPIPASSAPKYPEYCVLAPAHALAQTHDLRQGFFLPRALPGSVPFWRIGACRHRCATGGARA